MMRALARRVSRISTYRAPGECSALPAFAPVRRLVDRVGRMTPAFRPAWASRPAHGAWKSAERACASVGEWARAVRPDVLFACYASRQLCTLEAGTPVVYFSDITARLLTSTYPEYSDLGPAFADVADRMEAGALARAQIAAFPSDAAYDSAVRDYGRDPERTFVVPLGANRTPAPWRRLTPDPPADRRLELCIVATEARRKRLDLAVAAAERLRLEGFDVVLNSIGVSTARSRRSRVVRTLGWLRPGDKGDQQVHEDAVARSHFMLLPSVGEAFGLAASEAAHFGRPGVVSDAGGLPTVVLDGVTGLVLPVSAGPGEYARAIAGVAEDPDRSRGMSRAALNRAWTILNWDAWGGRMTELLVAACGQRRGVPTAVLA
jgi:glycosyltransferase involved in cell wall biosynthesis